MRVYFVRHAIAEDRESFEGDDLLRPLSAAGSQKAKKVFGLYAGLYPGLQKIYTSEATRAIQSAELLAKAFGGAPIEKTALLNPGCDYEQFKILLGQIGHRHEAIAIVGHEPDFSLIIGGIVAGGLLYMEIKKASLIEVEMGPEGRGELKCILTPKLALKLKSRLDV